MKLNDQDVDWKEVALLLDGANEVLLEIIHELDQKYSRLQKQYEKIQIPVLLDGKYLNQKN